MFRKYLFICVFIISFSVLLSSKWENDLLCRFTIVHRDGIYEIDVTEDCSLVVKCRKRTYRYVGDKGVSRIIKQRSVKLKPEIFNRIIHLVYRIDLKGNFRLKFN